jgi:hypothetical protein
LVSVIVDVSDATASSVESFVAKEFKVNPKYFTIADLKF